ncbi:MAG: ATP11 family protein [Alphaproteobacteria bacterium]|nr:ATP11 family protein [Alphaproteobacteria bacterium]
MKFAPFYFLFAFCMLPIVAAGEWLPGFEDVPMMDKTYVVEEESFVYSLAEGKIVQATVISDHVSRRQLQRFYSDALRELGWRRTRDTRALQTFTRGSEELNIEIIESDPLTVGFTLTPIGD